MAQMTGIQSILKSTPAGNLPGQASLPPKDQAEAL